MHWGNMGSFCLDCHTFGCNHLLVKHAKRLSPCEVKIAMYSHKGMSIKEMAFAMGRTEGGVRTLIRSAGRKLGFWGAGTSREIGKWWEKMLGDYGLQNGAGI